MNREERRRLQRQAYKRVLRALRCEPECSRCHKPFDGKGQWVSDMEDGWIIDLICEGCTTQVDYSEAVVNDSIHDYMQLDSGRLWAWHKNQQVRMMPMG